MGADQNVGLLCAVFKTMNIIFLMSLKIVLLYYNTVKIEHVVHTYSTKPILRQNVALSTIHEQAVWSRHRRGFTLHKIQYVYMQDIPLSSGLPKYTRIAQM